MNSKILFTFLLCVGLASAQNVINSQRTQKALLVNNAGQLVDQPTTAAADEQTTVNNDADDASQVKKAPAECEFPFGQGQITNKPNPYSVNIETEQTTMPASPEALSKFRGADVMVHIILTVPNYARPISGIAVRPGMPFPIGEWNITSINKAAETAKATIKIVDCFHPDSEDTLVQLGIPATNHVEYALTPFLAAWNNEPERNATFEVALINADGDIWVTTVRRTVKIRERGYQVPRELLPPTEIAQRLAQLEQTLNNDAILTVPMSPMAPMTISAPTPAIVPDSLTTQQLMMMNQQQRMQEQQQLRQLNAQRQQIQQQNLQQQQLQQLRNQQQQQIQLKSLRPVNSEQQNLALFETVPAVVAQQPRASRLARALERVRFGENAKNETQPLQTKIHSKKDGQLDASYKTDMKHFSNDTINKIILTPPKVTAEFGHGPIAPIIAIAVTTARPSAEIPSSTTSTSAPATTSAAPAENAALYVASDMKPVAVLEEAVEQKVVEFKQTTTTSTTEQPQRNDTETEAIKTDIAVEHVASPALLIANNSTKSIAVSVGEKPVTIAAPKREQRALDDSVNPNAKSASPTASSNAAAENAALYVAAEIKPVAVLEEPVGHKVVKFIPTTTIANEQPERHTTETEAIKSAVTVNERAASPALLTADSIKSVVLPAPAPKREQRALDDSDNANAKSANRATSSTAAVENAPLYVAAEMKPVAILGEAVEHKVVKFNPITIATEQSERHDTETEAIKSAVTVNEHAASPALLTADSIKSVVVPVAEKPVITPPKREQRALDDDDNQNGKTEEALIVLAFAVNTTALNQTKIRLAKIPRHRAEAAAIVEAMNDNDDLELISSSVHKDRFSHSRHPKPSGRADGREDDDSSSAVDDDKPNNNDEDERPERIQSEAIEEKQVTKRHRHTHSRRRPHAPKYPHRYHHDNDDVNVPQRIKTRVVKHSSSDGHKRRGYAYFEPVMSYALASDDSAKLSKDKLTTITNVRQTTKIVTTEEEPQIISALSDAFARDDKSKVVEKSKLASEVKKVINSAFTDDEENPTRIKSVAVSD